MNDNKKIEINGTGEIIEITDSFIVVDWFGGSKLNVNLNTIDNNKNLIKLNQWIDFTFTCIVNTSIILSFEINKLSEKPRRMSEKEIQEWYDKIPIAKLEPIESNIW